MPAPLIGAGAAVVARFIAKKGLRAASKKYTKTAIAKGKKHRQLERKRNSQPVVGPSTGAALATSAAAGFLARNKARKNKKKQQ